MKIPLDGVTCWIPSPSSFVSTTDKNTNNDANNENIPPSSLNVNTPEKHNTSLKRVDPRVKKRDKRR